MEDVFVDSVVSKLRQIFEGIWANTPPESGMGLKNPGLEDDFPFEPGAEAE